MSSEPPFWVTMLERFIAFIFLVIILPTLLFVGLFIRLTAGSPIILTDAVPMSDGSFAQSLRFRTTGSGTPLFRAFGRVLRRYGIDECPAFWSVARGDIRLREVVRYRVGT